MAYRYPSGQGLNRRTTQERLAADLRNVETGIRSYHGRGDDNPRLLASLEDRKSELEAAIRRLPKA